ncbi:MAG: hypothetical protein KatS3mg008_2248 [Acidimicrobiales bacterium]|nr:MAG: hypothetical protein KatS3mg008_2248 [Acidimicrobiales bacterium]
MDEREERDSSEQCQVSPDELGPAAGRVLVSIAERAVARSLLGYQPTPPVELLDVQPYSRPGATFVTFELHGELRGCIGSLEARRPLVLDVHENALAAAFADPRFAPMRLDEFEAATVKVSVVSPMRPLHAGSLSELVSVIGESRDGLLVAAGLHKATFLPAVWEKLPEPWDFVDALWAKAGLPPRTWPPDISLWTYSTVEYTSPPPRDARECAAFNWTTDSDAGTA